MATQRFDSESVEMRSEKISFPTILRAISYDCFVVVFSDIDGGRRRSRHETDFSVHSLSKRGQPLDWFTFHDSIENSKMEEDWYPAYQPISRSNCFRNSGSASAA